MATNTNKFGLYKKDPATDGADTFNIETMLNENWDEIDAQAQKEIPVSDTEPADPTVDPLWFDTSGTNPVLRHYDGTAYQPVGEVNQEDLNAHINASNPHGITTAKIGAEPSFIKNTAFNKNFGTTSGTVAEGSYAKQTRDQVTTHQADETNPHNVTKSQVGLGNVTDDQQATKTEFDNHTGTANIHRKITFGTADPTGGSDGDIYFQYE
ncbi:hypothetical protein [Salimicrobium halophilum]|uniref:Tail fiber protein n=1 Tax=Salimicrobium halophilum TaxID=86666 RepID=A0A1G8WEF6_9BACI|nr:hypothetical protein [Salimicrobium halophilum]SDJ76075.1 hypothetical protein SAMN04490247_3120 [Salimicrobium halophilum]